MIKLTLINSAYSYDDNERPKETFFNVDHILWFTWVPGEQGHHRAHTQMMFSGGTEIHVKETPEVLIDRISKARGFRAADAERGRVG
jgi:hypothetical protein